MTPKTKAKASLVIRAVPAAANQRLQLPLSAVIAEVAAEVVAAEAEVEVVVVEVEVVVVEVEVEVEVDAGDVSLISWGRFSTCP